MKTNLVVLSVFLIAFTMFSRCTKDSSRKTSTHFISATGSDGTSVNATDTEAVATENSASPYPYLSIYTGRPLSYDSASGFWIYSYRSMMGTYMLDGVHAGAYYNQAMGIARRSAHGTLVLTAVFPNIIGVVNFTCVDSTVVSASFSVPAP